uniref:Uncharacterized protein n=1 Tax=Romanomermis culicivorax TaxID=13658 RepID=A0A915KGI3_ROMCU
MGEKKNEIVLNITPARRCKFGLLHCDERVSRFFDRLGNESIDAEQALIPPIWPIQKINAFKRYEESRNLLLII